MEETKDTQPRPYRTDEYSVLITPPGAGRIYNLQVKPWQLRVGVVVGILLIASVLIAAVLYGRIIIQARAAADLKVEVEQLNIQLEKLEEIQIEIEKLDRLRQEVLELTGVSIPSTQQDDGSPDEDGIDVEDHPLGAGSSERTAVQPQQVSPEQIRLIRSLVFQRPCPGPVSRGFLVDAAGEETHLAVDIAGSSGTGVCAAGSGVVLRIENDKIFGLLVVLGHGGNIQTLYGHNSKILVSNGERVEAGQLISEMGNTGLSSAPHLHFEIRLKDQPVNPAVIITSLGSEGLR